MTASDACPQCGQASDTHDRYGQCPEYQNRVACWIAVVISYTPQRDS